MIRCWQTDIRAIEQLFSTDASRGLSAAAVAANRAKYGPNKLREKKRISAASILLDQLDDFIIWVLIAAALVSGFLKEWVDALAIVAIVIINAILGFIQEYRAEKSLAALKKLSSPSSKVIRDGQIALIPSADIVPGDLIELEAGDNIPADGRLTWATPNFTTAEASLTGESNPVAKTAQVLEEEDVALADRANMIYLGTSVSSGKARAIVVGTGMETELGKIAGMIQEIGKETTPLQKKLEEFGKWIVYAAFILVALVFFMGLLRGGKLIDLFLISVSLAVAAIPEGLPAVVTISLALGVQRMVKRNALIRKLPSVETLGAATVICSDKTGTLTRNEMTVKAVLTPAGLFEVTGIGYEPKGQFLLGGTPAALDGHPTLARALLTGVLCNGSRLVQMEKGYSIVGDPTEGALLTAAAKTGLHKEELEKLYPRIEEIPFDSERKKMTILRREGEKVTAFIKGAPDVLLADCVSIEEKGLVRPMTDDDRRHIVLENTALADRALRVLAVAYRAFDAVPEDISAAAVEKKLVFAGLIAMMDPPREEVKQAVAVCRDAGIRTVMITGDHRNTAVAVARELGFFAGGDRSLTGDELGRMNDDELFNLVRSIPVYARVAPEHKLRIVRAWKKHGDIVAMTGDGVNDAPAVKEADIGVAMGITGTDVTKEVSDMVVTDDNFASIVAAVEEGRGIYDNIRKFIHYLLSCNASEILVMFTASLVGLPIPLLPIHILWVNLVTDGLPALALGIDPVAPGIMKKPPRPVHEPVITRHRAVIMVMQGSFLAVCSLAAFMIAYFVEKEGIATARTMAFIVLAGSQLFHSFNNRSLTESIFTLGLFSNMKLVGAVLVSFALQVMVVYVPFFHTVFKTVPLSTIDWAIALALSSFPLWAMEAVKLMWRRKARG